MATPPFTTRALPTRSFALFDEMVCTSLDDDDEEEEKDNIKGRTKKDIYRDWKVFEPAIQADNLVKSCKKGRKAKGDSVKGVSISGGNNSTLSESVP